MAASDVSSSLPAGTQTSQKSLIEKQDILYEQYLLLLHEYQRLRTDLSKSLSLGFVSLARANFDAPNHSRYGQDQYDQRMQALRVIRANQSAESIPTFSVAAIKTSANPSEASKTDEAKQTESKNQSSKSEDSHTGSANDKSPVSNDPIRWFGILVPQSLRSAQGHFIDAVEQSIAQLASIDARMRILEIEIRRTKKKISRDHS